MCINLSQKHCFFVMFIALPQHSVPLRLTARDFTVSNAVSEQCVPHHFCVLWWTVLHFSTQAEVIWLVTSGSHAWTSLLGLLAKGTHCLVSMLSSRLWLWSWSIARRLMNLANHGVCKLLRRGWNGMGERV